MAFFINELVQDDDFVAQDPGNLTVYVTALLASL